ncbi:MAG TPA: hypothetical protein VEG60_27995, partial [Candidatus Binatia bacterium]|nr:hypothetical protein [Candidatus Binatia bacterium]
LEYDVTFTKDAELVCRHAQCDFHTTTNILATPLAEKYRVPFTPAEFDPVTRERTKFPQYGRQGVYLDDIPSSFKTSPPTLEELQELKKKGVNILAPPMPALLTTNAMTEVVPSIYAERATQAGLKLISCTRSAPVESSKMCWKAETTFTISRLSLPLRTTVISFAILTF